MSIRNFGIIIVLLMVTGCASAPKYRYVDRYEPVVDHNSSVALLVDVCDQVDVAGKGDYCIIDESKEIAPAVAEKIQAYLKLNGIPAQTVIIPFVCGAFDNPENTPVKVAQKAGDKVNEAPKPYAVADEIKDDPEYLKSLTTLSTYVLERSITKYLEDSKKTEKPALIVNEDQFKKAVEVVKDRLNVSRLLYLGIKGTKISGGKKFGQGLLSFTVGVATAVATMGVVSAGNTSYGIGFIPGRDSDGAFSVAGLINLDTEELSWRNYSSSNGDPLEVKYVAGPLQIGKLLNDMLFIKEPIE